MVFRKPSKIHLLGKQLQLGEEDTQLIVQLVGLELMVFLPFVPVAHQDIGCSAVNAVIRDTLDQEGRLTVFLHLGRLCLLLTPLKHRVDHLLQRQLPTGIVQPVGPARQRGAVFHRRLYRVVVAREVKQTRSQRHDTHTRRQAAAIVPLGNLTVQGHRRTRIDEVPVHREEARDRVVVLELLADLLVVEGLQLPRLLVAVLRLVERRHAVELRVKGIQVQMQQMSVHLLGVVLHVLNHLAVGRVGTVGADGGLRLLDQLLVVGLVLGLLRRVVHRQVLALVVVDESELRLVVVLQRLHQDLVQFVDGALALTGQRHDIHLVVQAAQILRVPVVVVVAAGG